MGPFVAISAWSRRGQIEAAKRRRGALSVRPMRPKLWMILITGP